MASSSKTRAANRIKGRVALMGVMIAQKRYVWHLRAILRGLHHQVEAALSPELKYIALRQDAPHTVWHQKLATIHANIKALRGPAGKAFDEMSKRVNAENFTAAKTLLGITPSQTGTTELIADFREANIGLIADAAEDYMGQVTDILEDPDTIGMRVEDLADLIVERAGVSESRAMLIARDQTLKLNGQLNQTRQEATGVTQYVWSTSNDERVRQPKPGKAGPDHVILDGQTFSWDDPPVTNEATGETNHPGQDFQCRCVAIPVIDDLADL